MGKVVYGGNIDEIITPSELHWFPPARYNFAYPIGVEAVETILNGNPFQPTEK